MTAGERYRLPDGVTVTVARPSHLGLSIAWELVGPFGARWAVDERGAVARIEAGRRGGHVLRSTGWLVKDLHREQPDLLRKGA